MSATFKLSLPDQNQIRKLFKEEMERWSSRNEGIQALREWAADRTVMAH